VLHENKIQMVMHNLIKV